MGNTKDTYGKPVFDDGYDFPQDSQDAVDFADEFANVRRGTSTARQALVAGKRRDGMLWVESDTGRVFESRPGGAWQMVSVQRLGAAYNSSGVAQPGIGTTPADIASLSFSVTLPVAMDVRFRWGFQIFADNSGASAQIELFDGGSAIRTTFAPALSPGAASYTVLHEAPVAGMAAGTHTMKLQIRRVGSAGLLTLPHPAGYPSWLIAETY